MESNKYIKSNKITLLWLNAGKIPWPPQPRQKVRHLCVTFYCGLIQDWVGKEPCWEPHSHSQCHRPNQRGDVDTAKMVSNFESPGLSEQVSVADSKGEGNCGSHKRVGEIMHVMWREENWAADRGKET